jgi:hypothetical protein
MPAAFEAAHQWEDWHAAAVCSPLRAFALRLGAIHNVKNARRANESRAE